MTDGRVQVLDGKLTVDDDARISAAGGRVVEQNWRQLEREGWFG